MIIRTKEFPIFYPPKYNKKTGVILKRKLYKIITVNIYEDTYGNEWLTEESRHYIDVESCKAWLEENVDNYAEWMYSPNKGLGNKKPIDLLNHPKTIHKIHEVIDAIIKKKKNDNR
jgi:hypothetical protein